MIPDREETLRKLNALVRMDLDMVKSYRRAMRRVTDEDLREQLSRFVADHERHGRELAGVVRGLGGTPPEPGATGLQRILMETFTAIRAFTGNMGVIRAMKADELLSHKRYEEAIRDPDFSEDSMTILRRHFEDERAHLKFLLAASEATWDQAEDKLQETREKQVS
jgi:uncharacterized protein (TIGR02284 family)